MPLWLTTFAARIGVTGAIIAALCLALLAQTVRIEGFKIWPLSIEGWKAKAHRFEAGAKSCEVRHAATRQSVEDLSRQMAQLMLRAKVREAQYQQAKAQASTAEQRNTELAKASDARIARLRAMAAAKPDPAAAVCMASDELLNELEGL